jgi:SulP family sulfate permease
MANGPAHQTLLRMLRQPFADARSYRGEHARRDALAGLTVAVLAVPQALAYAVVAGVPPAVGLATLIVQGALGPLFASQPFLASGPTNTQALLVAAVASRALQTSSLLPPGADPAAVYLQLVVALTLFKGLLQMALAAGGLAALVRYVSASVILGFTAGAGILIAAVQLGPFLGIALAHATPGPGLLGILRALGPHLDAIRWPSLAVGAASLVVVISTRRLSRFAPGPLLAVVLGAVAVTAFGWDARDLPLVEPLPKALPPPQLPAVSLAQLEILLGGAFALAALGLMEAWSIGKTLAARTGQRLSAGQELFAQGFTNAASSFFGCIPGSGSFSRSALNVQAGAVTRYAGVWSALFATAMLLLFAPLASAIPRASLAAVLFVIAWELVDWRGLVRTLRVSRSDATVCLVTLVATLALPLAWAVFVGVLLNIGLYLRRASRLEVAEMVSPTSGNADHFEERPLRDLSEKGESRADSAVVFLQLQGDLFFGQADELADRLAALRARGARVVVIRLKRTLSIDSTVLGVLEQFALALDRSGGHLILCGVRPEIARTLRTFGIVDRIGEDCLFEATPGVFESAQRALARARELAQRDVDPGDWAREPDA